MEQLRNRNDEKIIKKCNRMVLFERWGFYDSKGIFTAITTIRYHDKSKNKRTR